MTVRIQQVSVLDISRRRLIWLGASAAAAAWLIRPRIAGAESSGIAHSAASIHQEPSFKAPRKRIYEALTESRIFDRVVKLSAAMQSPDMQAKKTPTVVSKQAGGAFSAFGGYISGRQIELLPDELIVQAWRAASWDRGVYSIARFELVEHGAETTINFDHTGFPPGQAEHLAAGWEDNYWAPLRKYLSQR